MNLNDALKCAIDGKNLWHKSYRAYRLSWDEIIMEYRMSTDGGSYSLESFDFAEHQDGWEICEEPNPKDEAPGEKVDPARALSPYEFYLVRCGKCKNVTGYTSTEEAKKGCPSCDRPKPKVRKEFFQWKLKSDSSKGLVYVEPTLIAEDGMTTWGKMYEPRWSARWKEKLSDTPAHIIEDWPHGS